MNKLPTSPMLGAVALVSVALAFVHAFVKDGTQIDTTTLWLVGLAFGCVALPEIGKLTVNKDGFSLETAVNNLTQKVSQVDSAVAGVREKMSVTTAQVGSALAAGVGGPKSPSLGDPESKALTAAPNDSQAGRWGGRSVANGYALGATVVPSAIRPDWYSVTLTVTPVADKPLAGPVEFHLHESFKRNVVLIRARENRASLDFLAWGAFTVGAKLADGTALELDLAGVPNAPPGFVAA